MADTDALATLLQRLQDQPGFPALSESVVAINEITNSEDQNVGALSAIIRRDFGLTANILRVANSVTYRAASGGGITTVPRAVSVLGFATLREIALTVVLFEQMKNRAHAREIREAILRAHLAGTIAREAGRLVMPRLAEEVYTYGLLHSLGQILVLLYLPEAAIQIQELVDQAGHTKEDAATRVLGVDLAHLAQGVTEQWLFPTSLVNSLRPLPLGAVARPETPDDMLWVLAGFGNEVCAALAASTGGHPGEQLATLRRRFADIATISAPQLHALVQKSFDDTKAFASTLGMRLDQSGFATQVTAWIKSSPEEAAKKSQSNTDATAARNAATPTTASLRDDAHQLLSAGIGKLSNSIVGDFVLDDVLRMALEILLHAMGFQRTLICMNDGKSAHMVGHLGCGEDVDRIVPKFRFPLQDAPNVFQLAIGNGLDIVIKDISDPKIADKIPVWYRNAVTARSFALMPLMIKNQPVALIYCDAENANGIIIHERELSLMKTLRNQVLLAIKQSRAG